MRKVIIPDSAELLRDGAESFLNRSDIVVFTVRSNEEALAVHRTEKVDLIVADLDGGTLSGERFCSLIRENEQLRRVSLIILHSDSGSDLERIHECRANVFLDRKSDPSTLIARIQELAYVSVRGAYRAPISVRVNGQHKTRPFIAYAENISTTGMMLDTQKRLSKGDLISCSFFLPDSTHVRTEATITRVAPKTTEHDPNQYGIRFLDLSERARDAIELYVVRRSKKP